MENLKQAYGKDNIDIELVAYAHGIGILKMDSVMGNRVQDTIANGTPVLACENTMQRQKLTKADMLDNIGYVPAGVIEILNKHRQGWFVVRP